MYLVITVFEKSKYGPETLFGMMQLLDPFIYFFDAVQQWYGNAYWEKK